MKDLLVWLDGKKTYICGTICALAVFANAQGWITAEVMQILLATFGFGTVAALRSGMKKGPDQFVK